MAVYQYCPISYNLNGQTHQGSIRIEEKQDSDGMHYRAVIESSPLRGTFGGYAKTIEMALDFLNLSMQAEGADEIKVECESARNDM